MKDFEVSIIIPNYNGFDLLKNNLPFVLKASKKKKNKVMEVIIVDDGSNDQSKEIIKKKYLPKFLYIKIWY